MATLCNHFYSHVNYSVTKICAAADGPARVFYSHVNYSVTKIREFKHIMSETFTVT